jgi:hypothetical protein
MCEWWVVSVRSEWWVWVVHCRYELWTATWKYYRISLLISTDGFRYLVCCVLHWELKMNEAYLRQRTRGSRQNSERAPLRGVCNCIEEQFVIPVPKTSCSCWVRLFNCVSYISVVEITCRQARCLFRVGDYRVCEKVLYPPTIWRSTLIVIIVEASGDVYIFEMCASSWLRAERRVEQSKMSGSECYLGTHVVPQGF